MSQMERLLAAFSVLLVFVYVVLRALYVPTFHDEAATIFHYLVPEKFLPYEAHWDANNHILNSALAYYCYKWFGFELIWIRLPNVLSFLIFGFYAIRMSANFKSQLVRVLAFLALITAAFPLEFFAQARGYGMSMAFLFGAIFHTYQFLLLGKTKDLVAVWLWMGFAVLANMALINMFAILMGITALQSVLQERGRCRNILSVLGIGLPILAFAVIYALELKERGLLYTGFPDGFVKITVGSLLRHQFGVLSPVANWVVTMLGLSASFYLIVKFVSSGFHWTMGRLTGILLLLNAMASISLNFFLDVNFPEDRVGVYFFPLFLITIAGAIDELQKSTPRLRFFVLSLAIFPIHLLTVANFNTTLLWPPWHVSESTYNFAVNKQKDAGKGLTISSHYLNELGWSFWNFRNDAAMQPLQRVPVPDTLADLLLARTYDFDFDKVPYHVIYLDEPNGLHLLERNTPVTWLPAAILRPRLTEINGANEFYELFNESILILPGKTGCLEFSASIKVESGVWQGHLVVTSANINGEGQYDYIPMHWLRPEWNGDELHLKRTYHFADDAQTFKVYFWNMNGQEVDMSVSDFSFSVPE